MPVSASTFSIIFVLGAPGAGKGTLCTHLARIHNLVHFSVGDTLRAYRKANPDTPLAAIIENKLENQGFLTSSELGPFLDQAIKDAGTTANGILIDGFPRCKEQAESFDEKSGYRPDAVLKVVVEKEKAKMRYLSRGRDSNDSAEKFEKRFAEYERESPPVEKLYVDAGILMEVDANGTKEENLEVLMKNLNESDLWQRIIAKGTSAA
ncbi:P-loop containing nucleoside triphosphate hydrolase protein [Byssothecium circinans]|uniref:P-loop containing nucleoside triphosphate hydrolase protein n=1 Tax=Byssothecium circinans TaxID=147558 RepID=A0A6A5TC27_9PLEO|nr:P-loop containing nucleoside triphosphate hydrolase protein [Byssothecium circinans]